VTAATTIGLALGAVAAVVGVVAALGSHLGRSPYQLAAAARLPATVAQAVVLKLLGPEVASLSAAELKIARGLAGLGMLGRLPRDVRAIVLCLGRRAGKSTLFGACFVVSECLRDWSRVLGPGEVGRFAIVAPRLDLCRTSLNAVAGVLDLLGVAYTRREGTIDLRPAGVPVTIDATVADAVAPRGASLVGALFEEFSMFPTAEGAVGRDRDVVASLAPGLLTTGGRWMIVGTPWAPDGLFFDLVEKGTKRDTLVIRGATWDLRPDLSEARCRAIATDERDLRREFGANFGESDATFLDRGDIAACVDDVEERPASEGISYVAALDAATRHDAFVMMVAHREMRRREGLPPADVVVLDCVRRWVPRPGEKLDVDLVVQAVAGVAKRYRVHRVHRDAWSADLLDALLAPRGVKCAEVSMATAEQMARFAHLGGRIRTGAVRLLRHEATITELQQLRARMHAGGRITYEAPARGRDDCADALALVVAAARELPPSGDIRNEVDVRWGAGGIEVRSRWYTVQQGPGGLLVEMPALPPAGTPDAERFAAERRAQGIVTPDDPEWNPPVVGG
jgi:hypothetical protein